MFTKESTDDIFAIEYYIQSQSDYPHIRKQISDNVTA